MLLSFLIYRPDVGYFWNMSYIAGTIMHYCDEAEAFICFANFVHQSFFIQLFFGHVLGVEVLGLLVLDITTLKLILAPVGAPK